ncbi:flagellar hook-length control protein FliK [Aquisalimonas asiatica]|uniref:Hook-length control protein FliK n=1 Tax=Aquisalimonas asiatica TaxID=406100 RepID=A0A1H8QSV5_9GAMM|nr:flagellar hook-length control protein FliK [Aquisalimonas asiatica]SEO57255.1 hook-length control protein FliK [Aquisalimonas asiatica]
MQGLQLLESAFREMNGQKGEGLAPDSKDGRAFLEALLETEGLRDSGLTVEDLEAWVASQGGKGLPLGGQDLPLAGKPGMQAGAREATGLQGQMAAADGQMAGTEGQGGAFVSTDAMLQSGMPRGEPPADMVMQAGRASALADQPLDLDDATIKQLLDEGFAVQELVDAGVPADRIPTDALVAEGVPRDDLMREAARRDTQQTETVRADAIRARAQAIQQGRGADDALLNDMLSFGGGMPGQMGGNEDTLEIARRDTLTQSSMRAAQLQGQQQSADLVQAQARSGDSEAQPQSDNSRHAQLQFQQVFQTANAAPQQAGMPTYNVAQSMDQAGWGQAVGERLVMMANQNVQQARIQVNPRELGPLDVNIQMRDDKTMITFQAQNAVTREALDAELPRLRMMLSDNGIENAEVTVGEEQPGHPQDGTELAEGFDRGNTGDGDESEEDENGVAVDSDRIRRGLVDHYA